MTREEAIKYIEQHNHIDDEVKDMCIEALGNDTNVGSKWIPCSERLPECDWGFENTEGLLFQLESGTIEAGFYGTGGKYRDRYFRPYRSDSEGFDVKNVIAWQPLPEPYKGE